MTRRYVVAGVLFVWACVSGATDGRVRAAASAQGGLVITGSVVDEDLAPLAGVAVALIVPGQSRRIARTSDTGEFEIPGVPIGTYQLRTALPEYTPVVKRVQVHRVPGRIRVGLVMPSEGATLPMVGDPVPPMVASTTGPRATRNAIVGTVTDTSGGVIPGATVTVRGDGGSVQTVSNLQGLYQVANLTRGTYQVTFALSGFKTVVRKDVRVTSQRATRVDQALVVGALTEAVTVTSGMPMVHAGNPTTDQQTAAVEDVRVTPRPSGEFIRTADDPRSTFGADVDTASYTNVRRYLSHGQLPPREAVRVEEFVNYFTFAPPPPTTDAPITLTSELGEAPWAPGHKLVLVGAHARAPVRDLAGRNFVLLVDVSGSMQPAERLPLLKSAFALFVDSLQPNDEIAIVTYAGSSGVWLLPTPARERDRIQAAIAGLTADGTTNGGEGLALVYRLARQQFVPGGINRVLLATDGDFNVGMTADLDLVRFVERERRSGVFLSVLGVGTNNLRDGRMEQLADNGNGHYAYLDSLQEARRVLIREAAATLEVVAQDVKFQVEFNPAHVQAWRLVGYENRVLGHAGFEDDRVDAGELGDGHTVTVLYEVVPVSQGVTSTASGDEWLNVRVRYQPPGGGPGTVVSRAVGTGDTPLVLPFAAAVAEFALLLRDGDRQEHPGRTDGTRTTARWDQLLARVRALGAGPADQAGERGAFAEVVALAAGLRKLAGTAR